MPLCRCMTVAARVWALVVVSILTGLPGSSSGQSDSPRRVLRLHAYRRLRVSLRRPRASMAAGRRQKTRPGPHPPRGLPAGRLRAEPGAPPSQAINPASCDPALPVPGTDEALPAPGRAAAPNARRAAKHKAERRREGTSAQTSSPSPTSLLLHHGPRISLHLGSRGAPCPGAALCGPIWRYAWGNAVVRTHSTPSNICSSPSQDPSRICGTQNATLVRNPTHPCNSDKAGCKGGSGCCQI